MAIIQKLGYKQRLRILFSRLPRNLFELYCREQRKQYVQINPIVLLKEADAATDSGGFVWCVSTLGGDFWYSIAGHIKWKRQINENVQSTINDAKKYIDFRKFR